MHNLKVYFTTLLLYLSLSAGAQTNKKFWSSYNRLRWSDYHGQPDSQSQFTAFTYFGLDYSYRGTATSPYLFKFEVNSYMDRGLSWRKGTPSINLLKHEQLHFDIAEYFAGQLLQAFNTQVYTENYKAEIAAVEQRIARLRRGMEEIYDAQTLHSVNRDAQALWDSYVAELMSKNYTLMEALNRMPKPQASAGLTEQ